MKPLIIEDKTSGVSAMRWVHGFGDEFARTPAARPQNLAFATTYATLSEEIKRLLKDEPRHKIDHG